MFVKLQKCIKIFVLVIYTNCCYNFKITFPKNEPKITLNLRFFCILDQYFYRQEYGA